MAEYWVSAEGSDSNSGTDINSPWQSLAKVKLGTYHSGDKIFLRRGDVFYGTLTVNSVEATGEKVLVDAYGDSSLSLPLISKYKIINSGIWEEYSDGVFRADLSNLGPNSGDPDFSEGASNYFIGHLVSDGVIFGMKKTAINQLVSYMDFYPDGEQYIYIKSQSAPISPIYCASGTRAITFTNAKNLEISNLAFIGSAQCNVTFKSSADVHMHDCRILACGGGTNSLGGSRVGNGIQLWYDCKNILIEHCDIEESYDAGTTFQATTGAAYLSLLNWHNCVIRRCKIMNSPYAFEWFASTNDGSAVDSSMGFFECAFKQNLVLSPLSGWSAKGPKPDLYKSADLVTWDTTNLPSRYAPNSYIDISENLFMSPELPFIGNNNQDNIQGTGLRIVRNTKLKDQSTLMFRGSTARIYYASELESMFPSFVGATVEASHGFRDTRFGVAHLCGVHPQ